MSNLSSVFSFKFWETLLEFLFKQILVTAAAIVLFGMMLLTLIDVLGRYLFDSPLAGGFEITEILLAAVIFLGLPLVTAYNKHVEVDLLDARIPQFLKPLQNVVINLINLIAFGTLSWMLWKLAFRTYRYEDASSVLQIPYAGLVFLMAVTCTLAAIGLVIKLFRPDSALLKEESSDGS